MAKSNWNISINAPFAGYSPAYYENSYPSFGNKNMAGEMQNVDMIDPDKITQGPGLSTLTAGDENGAVTELIHSVLEVPVANNDTYAVGGTLLHKLSATAVTNAGSFPHTIDKAAVTSEDAEDVIEYQGNLYYSYNHSGSAGDLGKYDLSSTFDDDWGSTVPTGMGALEDAPHQMIKGGDILYIANGRYVGTYDGTTYTPQNLDLPQGSEITSIAWLGSKVWVAANEPNLDSNSNLAHVYVWDGTSASWDDFPHATIVGRVGGMIVKNSRIYIFYEENGSNNVYKLGIVSGSEIVEVATYSGSLPDFNQISVYKNYILWVSSGLIHAWGARTKDVPVNNFQIADGGYSTVGSLDNPFGTPMVASTESSNYKLAKFNAYDVSCNWKSLMFDVSRMGGVSMINKVSIYYDDPSVGSEQVDVKITVNQGASTTTIFTVSNTNDSGTIKKTDYPAIDGVVDFRVELDWSNGSATNPLKVRKIEVEGTLITED